MLKKYYSNTGLIDNVILMKLCYSEFVFAIYVSCSSDMLPIYQHLKVLNILGAIFFLLKFTISYCKYMKVE